MILPEASIIDRSEPIEPSSGKLVKALETYTYRMLPAVILVRPRAEGNVGSVARAMVNMGLERLILVEPAPALGGVARGFGVGGWDVLDRAERVATFEEAIMPFRRIVGTTSARARAGAASLRPGARELPGVLRSDPPSTATALVFGPEDSGLTRRQLEACHPVVVIPCAAARPTLNLAQSVLILAYELHLARRRKPGGEEVDPGIAARAPAEMGEVDVFLRQAAGVLHRVGYDQKPIRRRLVHGLRQLLRRSDASSREMGALRRILNRIAKATALDPAERPPG